MSAALYSSYLFCYDVNNDRLRNRLFRFLKDLGLIPVQKSVFYGWLSAAELSGLQREVSGMLDPETDRAFWVRVDMEPVLARQSVGVFPDIREARPDGHAVL